MTYKMDCGTALVKISSVSEKSEVDDGKHNNFIFLYNKGGVSIENLRVECKINKNT